MHPVRKVILGLLQQFELNQLKFLGKLPKMAEGTESAQLLTDNDSFHDIELCSDISILMKVTQLNGKALPVFSFTECQIVEKYKQYTSIEPVVLTLMGPHDVLLEFDKKADVIGSSMKVHGQQSWDGINVDIGCLMARKSKLLSLFWEREEHKKEKQELQREKDALMKEKIQYEERLGQTVRQMSIRLEQMDKKIEEVPLIPSGIITPENIETISPRMEPQSTLTIAPNPQLVMSPGLPLFSGAEPTPRDEGTYEQWRFQVRGMRSSCPEHSVRSALITSVRGEASELISFVGFSTPVDAILEAMDKRFGKRATSDRLQQEFYQLQQEKGERIQHFAGRLEKSFKKLQEVFPDRYQQNQLIERLFHGVNQQTRNSMRYLYDKESTTYDVLLAAIKDAETEWLEAKGQLRMKSAVVTDKTEMDELREKLDKLQATVKSVTAKKEKEKRKTPKTSPRKEDPRKQSKGPSTSTAGPFKPDQKPMQCYKCQG